MRPAVLRLPFCQASQQMPLEPEHGSSSTSGSMRQVEDRRSRVDAFGQCGADEPRAGDGEVVAPRPDGHLHHLPDGRQLGSQRRGIGHSFGAVGGHASLQTSPEGDGFGVLGADLERAAIVARQVLDLAPELLGDTRALALQGSRRGHLPLGALGEQSPQILPERHEALRALEEGVVRTA